MPTVSIVIPVWNGRRWLDGCLASIAGQTAPPLEVVAVDNGSTDGSAAHLRDHHPDVRLVAMPRNTGFAHAVNRGIDAAAGELVAIVNTDVELAPEWLERAAAALTADPQAAAVATKIAQLGEERLLYDAGDVLRRDGACEQRGRFCVDDGRFDAPGEVFGACAAAALYRREAVLAVGGFDERYFAYLEDADLALALRLAGWRCLYEPGAVARHAGEGSSAQLPGGHRRLVARNSVLLVAKWFPARWLPLVAYRQASWLWHAARQRRLADHLRGLAEGAALAAPVLVHRARRRSGRRSGRHPGRHPGRRGPGPAPGIPIDRIIPPMPIRGPRALGHRSRHAQR